MGVHKKFRTEVSYHSQGAFQGTIVSPAPLTDGEKAKDTPDDETALPLQF